MEKKTYAVLIVEKDPIIALDLQGIMINIGHDVVASVSEADAAVAAVGRFKPDVVLMGGDIIGGKSFQTASKIIREFDCPVVFCLSPFETDILEIARKMTSCEVVFKPVNAETVGAVINMSVYKHELEKSIMMAEEKVKQLTGLTDILDEFQDKKYTFRWKIDFSGFSFCNSIPEAPSIEYLKKRISEKVLSSAEGVFSFVLDFPVIPSDSAQDKSYATAVIGRKKNGMSHGYILAVEKVF